MVRYVSPALRGLSLVAVTPVILGAQAVSSSRVCEGAVVGRIEVHAERPPFSGTSAKWRAAAHAIGLHHATTREEIVKGFLALHVGRPCTEFRRAESERVLRAQRFISDATVKVVPDTGGTVAAIVTTVDEVPVLVNARFRGIRPEAFTLGNLNIAGLGTAIEGHVENGRYYRTELGASLDQSALFGHPYRLGIEADRYRIGSRFMGEMEHPFYTDLQRVSWHMGFDVADNYPRFERPALDPLALQAKMRSWNVSTVLRVFGTSTVTLLGGGISGRQFEPADRAVVVSDTGMLADTGNVLRNRYREFRVGRIGAIAGIRRVHYQTVHGFDALIGAQDVARGGMIGLYAGGGLSHFGETDMLVSSALYLGAASENALLATLAEAEARRSPNGDWDSVIGSARTALYWGRAPGVVFMIDNRLSAGRDSRLPLQLSFRDPEAGMAGYRNSGLAGAVRNVARAEVRVSGEALIRRADLGFAAFSEVGTLWAGDAPYGVNATRTSVGIGLLGAYPTRSKRMYRADLVIPLTRTGTGVGRIEVRFSSLDRTQNFWKEPSDVSSARTGVEPSRLFAWPSH